MIAFIMQHEMTGNNLQHSEQFLEGVLNENPPLKFINEALRPCVVEHNVLMIDETN